MSQQQTLINHFKLKRSITQLYASDNYRILRLSERIRELERKGWEFSHQMIDNKQCSVGKYCRYILISRPNAKK